MKFGSVCSGIEAASVAWHPLGWEAAWLSEIEPFPCAVLKHHYPDVPNYGDMTLLPDRILSGEVEAPDLFCGGTPCQAFSVAGLRNSLKDSRGNLSLTFVGIANAIDHVRSVRRDAPAIIFWENVPGVLNTKDNAFGCFLGALAGETEQIVPSGDKWTNSGCVFGPQRTVAWRVLDAQYFGVAQRRRRVFVVASARDDFDPAAVLFEFEGVRRDTAPSREARKITPTISSSGTGVSRVGFNCEDEWFIETPVVGALDTECGGNKMNHQTINSGHLLPVSSFYESSLAQYREATLSGTIKASGGVAGGGSETFLSQPIAFPSTLSGTQCASAENIAPSMGAVNPLAVAQPVGTDLYNCTITGNISMTLKRGDGNPAINQPTVMQAMAVRRLTPVECERLQGFPDGYTNIPWRKAAESPDGPRYKALGNSWAVPVVRWIGKRIQERITT
jgi:DNA (cytosine-5)-methyltransferase 1